MSERNQPIISGIEGTVTIHSDVDATTSAILLNNWTAIIAPTVTDDSALGYAVGSEWTDVTADKSYKLVDASVGTAIWKEITAAGGGDLVSTNNLSDVADPATSLSNLGGQPLITQNTAFNKDFGTTAGTVLEGDTIIPTTVFTPTINSTNMVEVSQESDFGTPDGSGNITLVTGTTYFIRGIVSCPNRLVIASEGISVVGWDRDKDGLNYTGSGGDFITVTDVNFEMLNLKLLSGNAVSGEVVLRASNFNYGTYNDGRLKVLTLINLQFRGCYDVHHIEGFDLVDIQNCLFWYIQATTMGCHFKNCSKLQITSCEFVRWFDETLIGTPAFNPALAYLIGDKVIEAGIFYESIAGSTAHAFDPLEWTAVGYATAPMVKLLANGAGNGFGAVNITGSILHPQQTQNGIDINTGSTAGFGTIASSTFINIGLTTGETFLGDALTPALGAYSETECLKYDIFANQGIPNSTAYGSFYDSTSGTVTSTGGTINWIPVEYGAVPVAAGTQRVSFSTPGTQRGVLTYNGTKDIFAQISVSFVYNDITGGTDEYDFGLSKNGGATPVTGSIVATIAGGGAYFGVTLLFTDSMVTGDDYELLARNQGGGAGDDIEVISVQFLIKE
jgi:hypothetical protein